MDTLTEALDSLGATAHRIADERMELLLALRNTINTVDIHGSDSGEYQIARAVAITLLTRFA